MAKPIDLKLYEKAKQIVYRRYSHPSAYRSMALVKLYKDMGGKYYDDGERKLDRWRREKWEDVNPHKTETSYPVYRPTVIINKNTPKTKSEIPKKVLLKQSKLKQKIKGERNLPEF